jgi:REP element-mobilizing transposase RayT
MNIKNDHNFKPRSETSKTAWYSRGYLPHFDGGELPQFITVRLFDSMPQELLTRWREDLKKESELTGKFEAEQAFRQRIEMYLDLGYGCCFLRDETIAEVLQNTLLFHDGVKYKLQSRVIMPNHAHFLLTPNEGFSLEEITHSIKSFTANKANKILNRRGAFWQRESFDRYIRSQRHFINVIKYIENNPVKAKLCEKVENWRFSSAHYRNAI